MMIVDKINKYLSQKGKTIDESLRYEVEKLAGVSFRRQFMVENGESKGTLRLSSAGKCARQLAYAYHGYEKKGKEIDSRAKIIFWTGDLMETMIVSLAKLAGCQMLATGLHQVVIGLQVNGHIITGHPDGVNLSDKLRLVEVKSMSSYSFEMFQEKGHIDDSYIAQINCYMQGLSVDECIFVGINKDSGVMHEKIFKKDSEVLLKAEENLSLVLKSTPEELPVGAHVVDSKGICPWQCLYCAYWRHCRPNAEKVLVGKSYKLKERGNVKTESAKENR